MARRDKPLKTPELYDLEKDPRESHSLCEQHPKVVARLLKKVAELQAQVPKVWDLKYPVRDPAKLKSGIRRE